MSAPDDAGLQKPLRVMQVIAGAMLGGILLFLAVALYLVFVNNDGQGQAQPGTFPVVSLVAIAVLVVNAPLAVFIPGMVTRNALRQIASGTWKAPAETDASAFTSDQAKLVAVRQTTLIITFALFEGAALLGCIAFLLEGQLWVLVAVVVALGFMLVNVPTESRFRAWLAQQAERVAELRRRGDVAADQ